MEARYKLQGAAGLSDEALLEAIGRKRGALLSGAKVNLQKAAEIVIHEFRAGSMGRTTLETPEEFSQWLAAGQKVDAERQLKADAIEQARLARKEKNPRLARKA